MCSSSLGGRIELYKNNLVTLLNSGKPVVFRLPVIGGYTDSEENRKAVVELIESKAKSYSNLLKIEILKEHNLGTNKYQSLIDGGNEIMLPEYNGVSDELMGQYKIEIEEADDRWKFNTCGNLQNLNHQYSAPPCHLTIDRSTCGERI